MQIIKPNAEWVDASGDYLLFLERCCRTCYHSEDRIQEGSAEKLLKKIVDSEHFSVLEHVNAIIDFTNVNTSYLFDIYDAVDLFAGRTTRKKNGFVLSGNMRMWIELVNDEVFKNHILCAEIKNILCEKWPFFFSGAVHRQHEVPFITRFLDENPLTNRNQLSISEMKKHMTLTYKLTMSRSGTHQAVRHRRCSFSQNSQRYIDYGKKEFECIMPPSAEKEDPTMWKADLEASYNAYLYWKHIGLKPEDARELLPNAAASEIVVSSTIKNWVHIFNQRSRNKKAQWQIQSVIKEVEDHMKSILPSLF